MIRYLGIFAASLLLTVPLTAESEQEPAVAEKATTEEPQASEKELPEYIRNAPTPELPENLPDVAEMQRQFIRLEKFLALPPEELARIRETIERIEAMDPERRQEMRETLRRIRALDPHEQIFLREISAHAEPALRERLEMLWRDLPRNEKTLLVNRLQKIPAEERSGFLSEFASSSEVPASEKDEKAGSDAGSEKEAARD